MKVFTGFKKHIKSVNGPFSFFSFSATFCRFKPVKTGKWQKILFAGKNANPVDTAFFLVPLRLILFSQRIQYICDENPGHDFKIVLLLIDIKHFPEPLRIFNVPR